jgi:hypothetical protein
MDSFFLLGEWIEWDVDMNAHAQVARDGRCSLYQKNQKPKTREGGGVPTPWVEPLGWAGRRGASKLVCMAVRVNDAHGVPPSPRGGRPRGRRLWSPNNNRLAIKSHPSSPWGKPQGALEQDGPAALECLPAASSSRDICPPTGSMSPRPAASLRVGHRDWGGGGVVT